MAGLSSAHRALILVFFLMCNSLAPYGSEPRHDELLIDHTPMNAVEEGSSINLSLSQNPNFGLELELPEGEPLVQATLDLKPKVQATQTGLRWDSAADWGHIDAIVNGTTVVSDALTGTAGGQLWDFNNGAQGWTFSNTNSLHVTSPACGLNGSTGGSIQTYAGATYATSPTMNLAGGQNIPFHAWVLQGSASCGEEPDSGEDLAFQYITSAGTWVTFQTFSGATTGGSSSQLNTILPAAALHSASQFRAYQNSGSGTCCDFWFFDDVRIATPEESNWTSPSIGYKPGSSFMISRHTYSPMLLEANIPEGAFVNWSVLDENGNVIPGMTGVNSLVIPLNLIDSAVYDQFRIHLRIIGSQAGGIPVVYSMSTDGSVTEGFHTAGEGRGWTYQNISFVPRISHSIAGGRNSSAVSPWYPASAPVYSLEVDASLWRAQLQLRTDPLGQWQNISVPYAPVLNASIPGVQIRVIPLDTNVSNFTTWGIDELTIDMFGGQQPTQPTLDFKLDDRAEWGAADTRVGSWGWQDRFTNSQRTTTQMLASGMPRDVSLWVPVDEVESFSFIVHTPDGTLIDASVFVGQTMIANRSFGDQTSGVFVFTSYELSAFQTALSNVAATLNITGTRFTEIEITLIGQGEITLGGLAVPYPAHYRMEAGPDHPFTLGINDARSGLQAIGGFETISLPFKSLTRGGLEVSVESLLTSGSVILDSGSMAHEQLVLTSSEQWQTIHASFDVVTSSIDAYRLDIYSQHHLATFRFDVDSLTMPIGLNEHSMIELHPTKPIERTESGGLDQVNITFRVRPVWDDETSITATVRVELSNSVISIPFSHTWGTSGVQGYENDLAIKSIMFSDDDGLMSPSRIYLQGGTWMNVSVRIGYESIDSLEGFVNGDALVTLYRNGEPIVNTTSVENGYWNFTTNIPFTYADVVWDVELTSLSGSSVVEPSIWSRTFTVDSVKPRILSMNVEPYDHRTPSPTQVLQVTITDQPVLPTDVQAMVWKEWLDDTNFNGWPDPGEYHPVTMLLPSDLTALTGQYTLMHDDTGGSLGQKVSVYLEGQDPSGYALQDAGSASDGDQLFMYQLAVDGEPEIEPGAFAWSEGRKSWVHPDQPYELNIQIHEPNGGADLAMVEVSLAHNQGSDAMPIRWDFKTGNCTTTSVHIMIDDCEMLGANGLAHPYEKDMTLNIQLHFGWNTPDLGESRREPAIRVVDRAGQEVVKTFPESRWRFSAGLEIPEESVDLHLTSGAFLGDGARVTPLTEMEISGGLVFLETSTVPHFDCEVDVLFAGRSYTATARAGIWSVPVQAPLASGSLPLTWSVGCLQGQGQDLSNKEASVKWILVDGTGPQPVEILAPRPGSTLSGDVHEVKIIVEEIGGLDVQSLELNWRVEDFTTGDVIRSGDSPLSVTSGSIDGLRIELSGLMNLSSITDSMLVERMVVHISISGRDLAGNPVQGIDGKPAGTSISTWNMQWFQPEFTLSPSSLSYSRLLLEVGDSTSLTLEVENIGTLDGEIEVVFKSIELDGTESLIQRTKVIASAGSIGIVTLDWGPQRPGFQWVEATLANGQTASGPTIDVRVSKEPSFSEKVFGDVNPILGSVTGLLFVAILATLLLWMKRMTTNQGAKVAFDWDEFSSEIEDDHDDGGMDDLATRADPSQTESSLTSSPVSPEMPTQASAPETDWVMGSDGYWWYHDKVTNEWWYKDADGNIVKHP